MTGHGAPGEVRVLVREEADVAVARAVARELALGQGFAASRMAAVATAVTEIARNIVMHAGHGEVRLAAVAEGGRRGIVIVARDESPGIPDAAAAMQDGFSTSQGLGLGLPGARRLMDEFTLVSAVGAGTTVTMKKWARDAG